MRPFAAQLTGALNLRVRSVVVGVLLAIALIAIATPADSSAEKLDYHGGEVMRNATVNLIFWLPPTLQDGTPAPVPSNFIPTIRRFFTDVNNTGYTELLEQYYEENNHFRLYITKKLSENQTAVFDGAPYPSSFTCLDPSLPNTNCISDGTVQNLIRKVINSGKAHAGNDEVFVVYVAPGEYVCSGIDTCFATSGNCAYHNFFHTGFLGTGSPVVYAVQPYTAQSCNGPFPLSQTPNGQALDAQLYSSWHEVVESITDPFNNGWYGAQGGSTNGEIADKCNGGSLGNLVYDDEQANELLNGDYYLLSPLWSNKTESCVRNLEYEQQADVTPIPGFTEGTPQGAPHNEPDAGPGAPVALGAESFKAGTTVSVTYTTGSKQLPLCPAAGATTVRSDGSMTCKDTIPTEPAAGPVGSHTITFTDGSVKYTTVFNLEAGAISPWLLNFGNVPVNSISPNQQVTLTNDGYKTITVAKVYAQGQFDVLPGTSTCIDAVLPPGKSCVVEVYYYPQTASSTHGWLVIEDSGNREPQRIKLEGTSIVAQAVTVKQLNPTTSPGGGCAEPFSSGTGFEGTPAVVHESVDLSAYDDQSIRLRFLFSTDDELYNAFEGWYLRNIKITGDVQLLNQTYPVTVLEDPVSNSDSDFTAQSDFGVAPGWHVTDRRDAVLGGPAWWYGNDATGTYQGPNPNGSCGDTANSGTITSNVIKLAADSQLTFDTLWQIESVDPESFDLMDVQVIPMSGTGAVAARRVSRLLHLRR